MSLESNKPSNNEIQLTKRELSICIWLGPLRTKAARASGKKNMIQVDNDKERFIEINGLCGELVFAKYHNFYPYGQLEINARTVTEDNGDFIDHNKIIDVKTTEYTSGRLTCSRWKNHNVDIYCLIIGNYRNSLVFNLVGYMTGQDLIKESRFGFLPNRNKKQYIAEQKHLYSYEVAIQMSP